MDDLNKSILYKYCIEKKLHRFVKEKSKKIFKEKFKIRLKFSDDRKINKPIAIHRYNCTLVTIQDKKTYKYHANAIIYKITNNILYICRYEPHGYSASWYDQDDLDEDIKKLFENDDYDSIVYLAPKDFQ